MLDKPAETTRKQRKYTAVVITNIIYRHEIEKCPFYFLITWSDISWWKRNDIQLQSYKQVLQNYLLQLPLCSNAGVKTVAPLLDWLIYETLTHYLPCFHLKPPWQSRYVGISCMSLNIYTLQQWVPGIKKCRHLVYIFSH